MNAFLDGLRIAGVIFVGVILLVGGIVLYAIGSTMEAIGNIIGYKKK